MDDEMSFPPAVSRHEGGDPPPLPSLPFLENALLNVGEWHRYVGDALHDGKRSSQLWAEFRQVPELIQAIQACIDALYPGSPASTHWGGSAASDITLTCYEQSLREAEQSLRDAPEQDVARDG